jgi:hypothetical protein
VFPALSKRKKKGVRWGERRAGGGGKTTTKDLINIASNICAYIKYIELYSNSVVLLYLMGTSFS